MLGLAATQLLVIVNQMFCAIFFIHSNEFVIQVIGGMITMNPIMVAAVVVLLERKISWN